eukprot:m.238524 g.238524  ORF g.238524 m.238524 type:complete len:87 (+) comp15288_c0_seq28:222-482(+)
MGCTECDSLSDHIHHHPHKRQQCDLLAKIDLLAACSRSLQALMCLAWQSKLNQEPISVLVCFLFCSSVSISGHFKLRVTFQLYQQT